MIDVVLPGNSEEKLLGMAEKLGLSSLCFLYEKINEEKTGRIEAIRKKTKTKIYIGGFGSAELVFADVAKENIANLVSNRKIDVLFGFESLGAKDSLKQRSSGLDPVLCNMMSEKKKVYCADFSRILGLEKGARVIALGRLRQNLMLCRKYKVEVAIASFASSPLKMRNPLDLSAFLAIFGHDAGKRPLEAIERRAEFNAGKRSGRIIAEGIEVV